MFQNFKLKWSKSGDKGEIFKDILKEFKKLNYIQDFKLIYSKIMVYLKIDLEF